MNAKSLLRFLGLGGLPAGALLLIIGLFVLPLPRSSAAVASVASLVRGVPSNAHRIELLGNVHPLAQTGQDAGAVPGNLPMSELKLVLKRSAAQDAALESLLAAQQKAGSPQYHHWLTPEQFGAQFGASDADVQAARSWLESQGFAVGDAPAGRSVLPFKGSAAQVEAAFQTPIHYFTVNGTKHFANTQNPQIPAALQALVGGVRGLHDFRARTNLRTHTVAIPDEVIGGSNYVTPTDFAIIYDVQSLYQHGLYGAGVTMVLAEQSDISLTIPANYWTAYGLYQNQQLSSIAAASATDPGRTGDENESEAYFDVEVAGALAPKAKMIVVRDKDVGTAFEYAINHNLGGILSISFSNCEKALGSANASVKSAFQQAVSQGITVLVSAGDSGVAECDEALNNTKGKTVVSGLSVNGLASTPYNVAVGGTDFNGVLVRQGNYWNSSNSAGTYANAMSYIPEMVWNETCGNPITATLQGYSDTLALCNSPSQSSLVEIEGAGGGLSSCITVSSSGACNSGYALPSWQSGVVGISGFTSRAIPDVSLIANNWIACDQSIATCGGGRQIEIFDGTSASAPALAAVLALADGVMITSSNTDGRLGNVDPMLYSYAASEYGSPSSPNTANLNSCNSNNGLSVGDNCVFYDITAGSSSQPCKVSTYAAANSRPLSTCATSSGYTYGLVEVSSSSALAYNAGAGYDLATGLGSINVAYLIEAIAGIQTPTNLKLTPSGTGLTLTWAGISIAKAYNIFEGTSAAGESSTPVQTGITGTTTTISGLTPGNTYYFYVTGTTYAGVATYPSDEAYITLPPPPPTGLTTLGTATNITLTWNASNAATTYSVLEGASAGGESSTPVATGITGTSYTISATAGKTYYFKVVAVGTGGNSAASNEAVGAVLPAAPTGVTATAGNGSVTLTWTAGAGATSYNVYVGTASGSESDAAAKSNVTGTSVTLSGLSNSTAYYFTVTSVNSAGASSPSSQASATPAAGSGGGGGGGSLGALELLLGSLVVAGRFVRPARGALSKA